jgi:CheY-like chemotaxis protein
MLDCTTDYPAIVHETDEDDMKTVLVVEDEFSIAEAIQWILEGRGFRVELAPDGGVGLERAVTVRPDLVITDLMMPKMSGIELAASLHASTELRSIPVILMSAAREPKHAKPAYALFLQKPFDTDALLKAVKTALPDLSPRLGSV